jgi:hypothetical protein
MPGGRLVPFLFGHEMTFYQDSTGENYGSDNTPENYSEFVDGCNEIGRGFFDALLTMPGKDAMYNGAFCFWIGTKLGTIGIELGAQCTYPGEHRYRTDFSLLAYFKTPMDSIEIDIEIDGHNFHEKTKEQVTRDKRRDRYFTAIGARILRFSGSEIFTNPIECWNEIFNTAAKLLILEGHTNV